MSADSKFKRLAKLKRWPVLKRDLLQAWDSADELLIEHLSGLPLSGKRILTLGDSFGALACALEGYDVTAYTDSYLSYRGTELNTQGRLLPLSELDALSGYFNLVLIRVPKNMSFLEDMLSHLSQHLHPGATVICGYMVKHQANASFELLNKLIGETHTSLAKKKARLIFAEFQRSPVQSPYPKEVSIPSFETPFINHSNLFSREELDIGTRFLLEHLPQGDFKTALDLGCANGIVGVALRRLNPAVEIIFSDESKMSIQSAQANYGRYFKDQARYLWTHCFENQAPESVGLVICNPPFHQGNAIGDSVARQMFSDAKHALEPGGRLRVIGNYHLRYPGILKGLFGQVEIVAENGKFVIVDAVKGSES